MRKSIFIVAAVFSTAIYSCKKDNDNNVGPYSSLSLAYQSVAPSSKTVTLDAATGGSFYGNNGIRYKFQPNSFITKSGVPVTGNVNITVLDIRNRADMIFAKVLPVSNGQPLNSGGEYNVRISQNGQDLLIKDLMPFEVHIPQDGTPLPGMEFFIGIPDEQNPNVNGVNWLGKQAHNAGYLIYNGDTLSIFTDSIGYGNADRFLTNPNYQTFTVNIAGVTIPANTNVASYASFDGYKTVWGMNTRSGNTINENHVPDIPVHFVVSTVIDGHFYGGIAAATPTTGGTYSVTLTQTDPMSFKNLINALP